MEQKGKYQIIFIIILVCLLSGCSKNGRYATIEQTVEETYELNCGKKYKISTEVWVREWNGWPADLVYYEFGVLCSEEELEAVKKVEYEKALPIRRQIWNCYGI